MESSAENRAAMVQAMTVFCLAIVVFFFGVPRAIGGILEGRINSEGGCYGARYDTISIWKFIRSARLGDCVVTNSEFHNAHLLKSQTIAILVITAIFLVIFCFLIAFNGPFGARDVGSALFVTLLVGGAFAIAAIVLFAIIAFVVMLYFAFFILFTIVAVSMGGD